MKNLFSKNAYWGLYYTILFSFLITSFFIAKEYKLILFAMGLGLLLILSLLNLPKFVENLSKNRTSMIWTIAIILISTLIILFMGNLLNNQMINSN